MTTTRRRGALSFVLLALGIVVACDRAPEQPAPAKGPAVTVVPVVQRRVPLYGQYIGQTESVQTVEIRARVEGYLEQQAVPDGGAVTTGQLLFTIDPRPSWSTSSSPTPPPSSGPTRWCGRSRRSWRKPRASRRW